MCAIIQHIPIMMHFKRLLSLVLLSIIATASLAQETRYLDDFAAPGGGGYPNDSINDHQAFVDAAAFFQANNIDSALGWHDRMPMIRVS